MQNVILGPECVSCVRVCAECDPIPECVSCVRVCAECDPRT